MTKSELIAIFGKNQNQAAKALGMWPQTFQAFPDDLTGVQLKNVLGALVIQQKERPEFVPEQLWRAIKE